MDGDEREALAGEYVLGTLDAAERRAAEARVNADPAFAAAVAAWQKRLQPLTDADTSAEPPPYLWPRIEVAIDAHASAGGETVVALRRSVRRWRLVAAVSAAAAAVLVAVVAVDRLQPPPQSAFVAVLTAPNGTTPAFIATVDLDSRDIRLVRVAAPPPPDKSYELWSILPDRPPHSLGVVEKAKFTRVIDTMPAPDVTLPSSGAEGRIADRRAAGPASLQGHAASGAVAATKRSGPPRADRFLSRRRRGRTAAARRLLAHLGQEHRIDDVDRAVGLVHAGDRHLRGVAGTVHTHSLPSIMAKVT